MQLLDALENSSSKALSEQLLITLEDIVNQVQIESNFCIRHPAYQPLDLPDEAVERFQQLPLDLQNKYLGLQLRSFLYGIYYNGSLKEALAPDSEADNRALHQNLENNTFLGVDMAFYERLHNSNRGEGYFDPDWHVVRQESDGSLAVIKNGLILHIDCDRHLTSEDRSAVVGDRVAIRLPRNRVQNGFYMAMGNNRKQSTQSSEQPEVVRVYFNLTSDGAVAMMEALTTQLNAISIPFSFKALYNPSDYGRYDSAVLYFEKSDYSEIHSVFQTVYRENQAHFNSSTPLFTKELATGLAIAEEPNQKFYELESFGMNRCQIVANGLLDAWQRGETTPEKRMDAILQHFSLLGIELQRPYLNANSEDIYTPLEL